MEHCRRTRRRTEFGTAGARARLRYHAVMPPVLAAAGPQGIALREAKAALRQCILATRDALPPALRAAAAAAIRARLIALPSYRAADTVLLTLPFRSEWDTWALVRSALQAGKVVVLPRVEPTTRMLVLHRITDPTAKIAPGYRGIPEPAPECPRMDAASIDWVLVPGVAFDREGGRLGYGGGFYDRLLPLLRGGIARVGGGYALQLVDTVPSAPHDMTVDTVVTDAQTLVTAPGRR